MPVFENDHLDRYFYPNIPVPTAELRAADIIVSTTDHYQSRTIRWATKSSVSHAMLCLGNGEIVEAIGGGVVVKTLELALQDADATSALVFRHRSIGPHDAWQVADWARQQSSKPYSVREASRAGLATGDYHASGYRDVLLQPENPQKAFFCSELVFAAFEEAGIPLIDIPSYDLHPGMVMVSHHLMYVGRPECWRADKRCG